jgi:hypothetical protein
LPPTHHDPQNYIGTDEEMQLTPSVSSSQVPMRERDLNQDREKSRKATQQAQRWKGNKRCDRCGTPLCTCVLTDESKAWLESREARLMMLTLPFDQWKKVRAEQEAARTAARRIQEEHALLFSDEANARRNLESKKHSQWFNLCRNFNIAASTRLLEEL